MVELYGRTLSRRDVAEHTGMLSQFAGVRLMTLGDGVERGIRLLEFRTGSGLRFTVLVDRALDIADCDYRGQSVGWNSPAGFKNAWLSDYEGEGGLGWLRTFSGLMLTCGLDHVGFMHEAPSEQYTYLARKTVSHSIHGRVATIPARLTGYGERWEGDECILWCEGIVQQSTVFGEDLHLIRRIEARVGSSEIEIHDRVVNHGFYKTPHMFCYHINAAAPFLEEGARYLAPVEDVVWASHAGADLRAQNVGYRTAPAPQIGFYEQVWQHEMTPDAAGLVSVALVNDRLGLAFEVQTRKDQFPCQYEWQHFQAGQYTIGLEPSTNHVLGHKAAVDRGELIWLEHGEERRYDATLRIHDGKPALDALETRIRAVAVQPTDEYPTPSGNFRSLAAS